MSSLLAPPKGILWATVNPEMVHRLFPARYERAFGHHVTLRYGVFLTPYLAARLGEVHAVRIVAEAWNRDIQALRVELPPAMADLFMLENSTPHLTLSAREGVWPAAAKDMLRAPEAIEPLDLYLDATVAFQPHER